MRFRLLQARDPGDPVIDEERAAFAARLGVPEAQVLPYDCVGGRSDWREITEGVDVVLVGGSGAYGMLDRFEHAWLQRFVDALGELSTRGFPTFASCFGFQGIVVALGGEVLPDPASSEVGTFELEKLAGAEGDPLFDSLPARFSAQLGHKDCATRMPEGVATALRSARCAHQAFRVPGKPVYATQFHPELTDIDNRTRFTRYYDLYRKAAGDDEADRLLREGFQPGPESNALLPRFAALLAAGALG